MKDNSQKTNDTTSKAFAHNIGNGKGISITTPLQTKLTIGAVNDPLEQEADAMADKVLQMPHQSSQLQAFFNPFVSHSNISPFPTGKELQRQEGEEEKDIEETIPDIQSKFAFDALPFPPPDDNNINKNNSNAFIQRKCAACGQEEKEQHIHRKENDPLTPEADSGLESYVSNLSSSGSPLSQETRSFFEPRFGYDFSNVRVHTDFIATKSADSINALAYTNANNIVFNQNQFSPETNTGKQLLAHELTHTIQQGKTNAIRRVTDPNFAITDISPAAGDVSARPRTIFFEMNSSTVGTEEPKIDLLAANTTQDYDLEGFASEEGSDATNRQLVQNRIQAVSNMLRDKRHVGARNPINSFSKGGNRLDYQEVRKVEVRDAGAVSPEPNCDPTPANPDPQTTSCGSSFTTAHPPALTMATNARDTMAAATGPERTRIESAVAFFFGSASHYTDILDHLNHHVIQVNDQDNTVQCHNNCDNTCRNAVAYMPGTTGPGAVLTLCLSFINEPSLGSRVTTLIHEAFHATTGLATQDLAYDAERGFTFIDPSIALRNTDTYVAFINEVLHPGSVIGGVTLRDVIDPSITGSQLTDLRRVMAYLEKWVIESTAETSSLYETIIEARREGSWTDVEFLYYQDTMIFLADIFGLTRPPAVPSEQDQVAVAGIFYRLSAMDEFLWGSNIDINRDDTQPVQFAAGPAEPLIVNDVFLSSGQHAMAYLLVDKLMEADSRIAASERPKYVELIEQIRIHAGHSAP